MIANMKIGELANLTGVQVETIRLINKVLHFELETAHLNY